MDINEIEDGLNKYGVDPNRLLSGIFQLQIENNALLHVILQNQASHFQTINENLDMAEFINRCTEDSKSMYNEILVRMLKSL